MAWGNTLTENGVIVVDFITNEYITLSRYRSKPLIDI
jgi:hypothetical protein